jgi:Ca-activated chloride channel homolog
LPLRKLAASVTPNRPDWRRHSPMLAFLHSFLAGVPKKVNIGIMALSSEPRVLQSPTTDRAAITAALDQRGPQGGTGTGEAIRAALPILSRAPGEGGKRPPAAIVLISDGAAAGTVDPIAAAQQARRLHIPIHTVVWERHTARSPTRGPAARAAPRPERYRPTDDRWRRSRALRAARRTPPPMPTACAPSTGTSAPSSATRTNNARSRCVSLALLLLGAALSLHWFGRLI